MIGSTNKQQLNNNGFHTTSSMLIQQCKMIAFLYSSFSIITITCGLQQLNYNRRCCSIGTSTPQRQRRHHSNINNSNNINRLHIDSRFNSRSRSSLFLSPSSSSNMIIPYSNGLKNSQTATSSSSATTILFGLFDDNSDKTVTSAPRKVSKTTQPKPKTLLPTTVSTTLADSEYSKSLKRSFLAFVASSIFCFGLYFTVGSVPAEEYFAGYLIEQSLSVDNLLVFLLLFDYFKVPQPYQNKILKWGIIGAVVMRAIMISLGAAVIHSFHAILLVFAAILIYSSGTILVGLFNEDEEEEEDLSNNWIVQFSRSLFPTTDRYDGDRFFTVENGKSVVTPMLLCLVAVELSDVVFAVDSIPAVFGITENPLIVFSSNMFAIVGLRSLYTVLAKAADDLKYLEPAVAVVLGFIGMKMVAEYFGTYVPTIFSLGVVVTMLSAGVILSLQEKALRDMEDKEELLIQEEKK